MHRFHQYKGSCQVKKWNIPRLENQIFIPFVFCYQECDKTTTYLSLYRNFKCTWDINIDLEGLRPYRGLVLMRRLNIRCDTKKGRYSHLNYHCAPTFINKNQQYTFSCNLVLTNTWNIHKVSTSLLCKNFREKQIKVNMI